MWKVFISDPFLNCDKIHPIQQKKVPEIKFLMWTACKMKFVAWHMVLLMQKGITEKTGRRNN